MTRTRTAARGFTLVELMVCVAIVGVLAAIAYPAYGRYLVKSNRSAAQSHLIELAQAEAQLMADSRTYADTVTGLSMTTPTNVSEKYAISIRLNPGPPAGFTIKATPIVGTSQANDDELSIDSTGKRLPDGKW